MATKIEGLKISEAKAIAKKHDAYGAIVIVFRENVSAVSYGKDKRRCAIFGEILESIFTAMKWG